MYKRIKNNKAFTLIELIVVVGIIGILVGIASPRFSGHTEKAKLAAKEADTKTLSNVAEIHHIEDDAWPILENVEPVRLALGEVEELYYMDEDKVGNDVNLKGELSAYGLAIEGDHEGEVFEIKGQLDLGEPVNIEGLRKQPITYNGVSYDDISEVPKDPVELFEYTVFDNGVQIDGISKEYIDKNNNGEYPVRISIPSKVEGKDVVKIKGTSNRQKEDFKNIEELVLPNTIIEVGSQVFFSSNIKDLVLPNGLLKTGRYSFYGNKMETVDLGETIVNLGGGTFESNRIKSVNIPESIEYIGTVAFYSNSMENIVLPNKYFEFNGSSFSNNQLPREQAFFYKRDRDGSENKKVLISYGGADRGELIVPDGIEEIGREAFFLGMLKGVKIPPTIKKIGEKAFIHNNSMGTVEIPKGTIYHENSFPRSVTVKEI